MNMRLHSNHQLQQGFSLVEIMVAMTLGLVLLGGTITIYSGSKDSYRLQENVAGMQENARFAIHALRRDVEMAGFPLALEIQPFDAAQTSDGPSDQFTIQYASRDPGNPNRDCLGAVVPVGTLITNRYAINNNGDLVCQGNFGTQTLVEDVVNMQALYGIDTDIDGTANLYATATEVNNGGINWNTVVSLRLALLVASESAIDPAQPPQFNLLDAPPITPNDGRLHRIFTATIPLRNRIP